MGELYRCLANIINLAFSVIPDSLFIMAIPFMGAIVLVKAVRSL